MTFRRIYNEVTAIPRTLEHGMYVPTYLRTVCCTTMLCSSSGISIVVVANTPSSFTHRPLLAGRSPAHDAPDAGSDRNIIIFERLGEVPDSDLRILRVGLQQLVGLHPREGHQRNARSKHYNPNHLAPPKHPGIHALLTSLAARAATCSCRGKIHLVKNYGSI